MKTRLIRAVRDLVLITYGLPLLITSLPAAAKAAVYHYYLTFTGFSFQRAQGYYGLITLDWGTGAEQLARAFLVSLVVGVATAFWRLVKRAG